MKTPINKGRLAGVVWGMAAVMVVGCATAEGDSDELPVREQTGADQAAAPPVTRMINVEVEEVVAAEFTEFIRITGEAEAYNDVTLSAEEGGVVAAFLVEKGRPVGRGDLIAQIDARVLTAQAAESRASANLAREQYERQRRLWEDEGMGTEIAYLEAKYQFEIATARLETLESRLAKTEIRSPVDGVFDDKFVEAGEITLPGTPVARVVSIDRVKITGGVPERFASSVRAGARARISFDILPGREFEGRIDYVGSSVDEQNRTFPIEIVIANPNRLVKPRMVANVELVRAALSDVIVVSQDWIRRSEAGYHVFVIAERDGQPYADARPVRLGAASGSRVVIEAGLSVGDRVITLGSQLVDAGSHVKIVDGAADGPVGG